MRIAVLGTGGVGQTLGSRLVETGHEVRMGSRTAGNAKAVAWAAAAGEAASEGSFRDAASWGQVVVNATGGLVSVEALTAGIVAKLLHDPTVELKDAAGSPRGERLAEALRDLGPAAVCLQQADRGPGPAQPILCRRGPGSGDTPRAGVGP